MLIKSKFSVGQRVFFPSASGVVINLVISSIVITKFSFGDRIYYRCLGDKLLYPEDCLFSSKFKCYKYMENKVADNEFKN